MNVSVAIITNIFVLLLPPDTNGQQRLVNMVVITGTVILARPTVSVVLANMLKFVA